MVDSGSNFTINCKVTDPLAAVSLWYKLNSNAAQKVILDGQKVVQKGQRFHFYGASPVDSGRLFLCKAIQADGKSITMDMGTLVVVTGEGSEMQH